MIVLKKLISLMLVLFLTCVSLVGCGDGGKEEAAHTSKPEETQTPMPMEKWVSPQGVVSVLKPKEWKVEESYTGNSASVVVCDHSRITGVRFFVSKNDTRIKDSLYFLGENVKNNRKKFPDFRCNKTWAAHDKSRAITEVCFTAKGTPVLGKFYILLTQSSC